jgi:hypothetical protein
MYNHASLRGGSPCADVVELVDTLDSKSGFFGSDGSSPSIGTIQGIYMHLAFKVVIPVVIYQTPVVITLPYIQNIHTYQVLTYQRKRFKIRCFAASRFESGHWYQYTLKAS